MDKSILIFHFLFYLDLCRASQLRRQRPAQASGWMNSESRQRLGGQKSPAKSIQKSHRRMPSKNCGSEQWSDPSQQLMVEFVVVLEMDGWSTAGIFPD
jgi:hypothetical protein